MIYEIEVTVLENMDDGMGPGTKKTCSGCGKPFRKGDKAIVRAGAAPTWRNSILSKYFRHPGCPFVAPKEGS